VTTALLLAGSALTLATGFPAGAQVAQNDSADAGGRPARRRAGQLRRPDPQLQPAVVNISTRQRVKVQNNNPFAGTPFGDLFGGGQGGGTTTARRSRWVRASSSRPTATS
jgi:serine protease Do